MERLASETRALDSSVLPTMTNENGRVLGDFASNYGTILKDRYGTAELDED